MNRICWKCKTEKDLDEFGKDKNRELGHEYICKMCKQEKDREVASRPEVMERHLEYITSDKGKEIRRIRQRKDYHERKYKTIARKMVEKAVHEGTLTKKNCEVCGNERSLGHHSDYSRPLEVTWLCQKHHSEVHRKTN